MGGLGGASSAEQKGKVSLQRMLVVARRPRRAPGDTQPSVIYHSGGFSPEQAEWRDQFHEELEGCDRSFDGHAGYTFIANVPNRAALRRIIRRHPGARYVQVEIRPLPPLLPDEAERLRALKERYAEADRLLRAWQERRLQEDEELRSRLEREEDTWTEEERRAHLKLMLRSRSEKVAVYEHHWLAMLSDAEPLLPHHPFTADLLQALVELYWRYMVLERLEPMARRLLAAHEALVSADDRVLVSDWRSLGRVLHWRVRRGDPSAAAGAEACFERALKIAEGAWPVGHEERLYCLFDLGLLLERAGRYEGAVQVWRRGVEESEQSGVSDPTGVTGSGVTGWLRDLGAAHRKLGRHEEEEQVLRRALEVGERALGPDHDALRQTLEPLAEACLSVGKSGEAIRLYERIIAIIRGGVGLASCEGDPEWERASRSWNDEREAEVLEKCAPVLRSVGREAEAAARLERAAALRASAAATQPKSEYVASNIQITSPDVFDRAWQEARERLEQESASEARG